MPQLTVRRVIRRGGKIIIRWSDKLEQEFDSLQQLRQELRAALQDDALRDLMRTLLLANCIRQATDGGLLASLDGKTISLEIVPVLQMEVTGA